MGCFFLRLVVLLSWLRLRLVSIDKCERIVVNSGLALVNHLLDHADCELGPLILLVEPSLEIRNLLLETFLFFPADFSFRVSFLELISSASSLSADFKQMGA